MITYLKENYNLSLSELLKLIQNNYQVAKYDDLTIISFNNNIKYNISNDEEIYFLTLLKLINYGNLEIRGTNIFTETANYIRNNLGGIYDYMWIKSLTGGERK